VKATIVRSGEASSLSANFQGKAITTDVTAAQVALWNEGRQSIKRDNVLRPVTIFTQDGSAILEATLRKSTRDVTQLTLNVDDAAKGRVQILWNILEHNDGGVIQLVYAGKTDVRIQADGIIEGQPQIRELQFGGRIKSPYEQYESERWDYRYLGYLLFLLTGLMILAIAGLRKAKKNERESLDDFFESQKVLQAALDRHIGILTDAIEFDKKSIEFLRKSLSMYKDDAEMRKKDEDRLNKYTEDMAEHERKIEQVEAEKAKEPLRTARVVARSKKYRMVLTGLQIASVVAAFILTLPATYLSFVASPLGPPFSF
jgi:hypothetical protein